MIKLHICIYYFNKKIFYNKIEKAMKQLICLLIIFLSAYAHAQNVGVGTTTPHPSAALDVSSSNKGFLPPRMSSSQRTAIANAKKGLMVYDTTQNEHLYFDGGKWRPFYAQNYDSAVVDYSSTASAGVNLPLINDINYSFNVNTNSGFIYDNGGPTGNYLPNITSSHSLEFDDSTFQIKLQVEEMSAETFYDSLFILQLHRDAFIFDTIAALTGNQLGTYIATGRVIIKFKSNNINNLAGFKIRWGRVRKNITSSLQVPLYGWHIDNIKQAAMGGIQFDKSWHTDSVGFGSLSYGIGLKAKGKYSVALGYYNKALSESSIAMGNYTTASGRFSTAMGINTTASGQSSVAIGSNTDATGVSSTAMGASSLAGGNQSTAMGYNSKAMGTSSFAVGENCNALGIFSSTIGRNLIAKGYASNVIGMYNDSILITSQTTYTLPSPTTPLFIIGNGDGINTRSNAMVVYKSGNVDINGNLKINNGFNEWVVSAPTGFAANRTAALSVTPSTFTDVLFTAQSADDGGDNYDPATGEFTAPTAGMYRFEASVYWAGAIAGFENIYFYVNGATKRFHSIVSANTAAHTLPFTASFKLNAGDVVKVVAYHTNAIAVSISANVNGTYFTGVKVY
jgi:hypothetical protein